MGVNNLGGEHSVIVAAVTQGSNSPAGIGRQKNCRGDCEPTPDGARWKGSHRKRRTETGEDLRAKRGRRSLVELREAYGRVQRFQILERVCTLGTLFQMEFEFRGTHGIQFVIEVAVYNCAGAVTDHG